MGGRGQLWPLAGRGAFQILPTCTSATSFTEGGARGGRGSGCLVPLPTSPTAALLFCNFTLEVRFYLTRVPLFKKSQ